jgi:hypothetical protein
MENSIIRIIPASFRDGNNDWNSLVLLEAKKGKAYPELAYWFYFITDDIVKIAYRSLLLY